MWQFIEDILESGNKAGLIVMVAATGSGPNRPGAKLAVAANGRRQGTVGGGVSEFALVKKAEQMLAGNLTQPPVIVSMSHKADTTNSASGMICDGTQQFAILTLTPADLPTIKALIAAQTANRPIQLVISPEGLSSQTDIPSMPEPRFTPPATSEAWRYEETLGGGITVSLVGGGHVALALSPLLKSIDMRVRVLDNRTGLDTMQANHWAEKKLLTDYTDIRRHIPAGANSYVCIMTFGHKHDGDVLAQLAEYPLGYLGLMGSPTKISQIRKRLSDQGISQSALDKIYAPIGIPIASNTPAEIAVSIAAQLIEVRNRP